MNKCEYCDSIFSTTKILLFHKKNTKYCLKKQQQLKLINVFKCEYCNIQFLKNIELENHKNICVEFLIKRVKELEEENKMSEDNVIYFQNESNNQKEQIKELQVNQKEQIKQLQEDKDKQIKELKEQVKELQEQIISVTKIAVMKNTNTTNNNTINNKIMNMPVLNLDDKNIQNLLESKYNLDIISEGQKGVARFALNNILKDEHGNLNYMCTDLSRKIFKYKNGLGEIEKDINAQKLTNILTDNGIKELTTLIAKEFWTNDDGTINEDKLSNMISKASEINFLKEDNTIFKNELASMTSI